MNPKLEKLLTAAAVLIATNFQKDCLEANGDNDDWVGEWDEYGYEDLDDISTFINEAVQKQLSGDVETDITEPKHGLEFVYYADDDAYIQWRTDAERLRSWIDVQEYLEVTNVTLVEETADGDNGSYQYSLEPITLAELQEVSVAYDIPIYNES